ncbi:carboxypeptidase M32 [Bacillus xiapuensis]|uniref:carboxypeptidase M32 n=1 Tax=Bacillus xiapuensis TaxID=2014075 RepID=UPI000C23F984|nr:carboxypeptidase M32 [Bacillus xiapuensis]
MASIECMEKEFMEYVQKMQAYKETLHLLSWDLRTGAPAKGKKQRFQVIGMLSAELFHMSVSEEMAAYIANLSTAVDRLAPTTKILIKECQKEYEMNKKIPVDEYQEYTLWQSRSEMVWEQARISNDFGLIQPYLEKILQYKRRFIDYWGYEENKYDALLHLYEPGLTVRRLDEVFGRLKQELLPLVQKFPAADKNSPSFLTCRFPAEQQKAFCLEILEKFGFDFEAGRLDETVHPFAIGLNPGDVRITTRYDEHDFRVAIFGAFHEAGHAIYEQNIAPALVGTTVCDGASMGIHESQSLFYENFIGRSRAFWKRNYRLLQTYSSGQLDRVSEDEFYRSINVPQRSLIRMEADEWTYPVHIIIRYEIEKALINGELGVEDLPGVWNQKYSEYLQVVPDHHANGVLQDIHWYSGDFGYFPSYGIGYICAAQLHHYIKQDLPFEQLLEEGDFQPIKHWLTERIHRYGKTKTPAELIMSATGESLNPNYLMNYLLDKYKSLY